MSTDQTILYESFVELSFRRRQACRFASAARSGRILALNSRKCHIALLQAPKHNVYLNTFSSRGCPKIIKDYAKAHYFHFSFSGMGKKN
jgi:hypothetical protein